MGLFQAFKMAIKSIMGNKIRSLLTMLGVIIGVGAVIAAVAFAQGSTKNITDSIESLGSNLIQISITGRNSNRNVTYEDLYNFAQKYPSDIKAIAPQVSQSAVVKYGSKTKNSTMNGTTAEYQAVNDVTVQQGRFIMPVDVTNRQNVAVIGTAIVKELFSGKDPIGEKIKINGHLFTVVGILQQRNNGQDNTSDDQVIIPVSVAQRISYNPIIRNFSIKVLKPDSTDFVMEELDYFLNNIYKDNTTYRVFNQAQVLSALNDITSTLMLILGGIATISLLVGGIGIMNIMLVSVTERTKEIGIRKAIGAKKRNILIQFLIEAVVVTGIGGIIGIAMGMAAIKFVVSRFVTEVYSLKWMLLSFGISLAVGIIFGMFPAYKASKLNPIEALRFE